MSLLFLWNFHFLYICTCQVDGSKMSVGWFLVINGCYACIRFNFCCCLREELTAIWAEVYFSAFSLSCLLVVFFSFVINFVCDCFGHRVQPDDIGAHINVGRTFNTLQNYKEAEKAYRKALSLLPPVRPGDVFAIFRFSKWRFVNILPSHSFIVTQLEFNKLEEYFYNIFLRFKMLQNTDGKFSLCTT